MLRVVFTALLSTRTVTMVPALLRKGTLSHTRARPSPYSVATVTMAFNTYITREEEGDGAEGDGEVVRCSLNTIVGMETSHSTWAILCENIFFP